MTHYDLLAVPRDASIESIRASFQSQMSQWASSTDPQADQRRHQIQSAYVVLSDPELRATYDARLAQQAREGSAAPSAATRIPSRDEIAAYENQATSILALDAFRDQRWAGFWLRVGAQMLDSIILYVPAVAIFVVVSLILKALHVNPGVILLAFYLIWAVLYSLYNAWLNSSEKMSTWGRRAVGVAVVSASDGGQISFGNAFGRGILSFFSSLFVFPNLLQLFTDKRQSLTDMIAATVVVKKRAGSSAAAVMAIVFVLVMIFVIGVLAAIAIPAYQDYTVRARVTEGLVTASSYKSLIAQNAFSGVPDLSTGFSAPPASVNVARVDVSQAGVITVTMAPTAKSVAFSLYPIWSSNKQAVTTPAPRGAVVTWVCKVDEVTHDRYVPSECRI
jgi:type IV pilus assembly protein PilA